VPVTESTAFNLSAFWRAGMVIAGTLGTVPLRSVRDISPGVVEPSSSWLDNPGGADGPTPYEWKETVLLHLLAHGNAYLAHVRNGGGGLAALVPFHPSAVEVRWATRADEPTPDGKVYYLTYLDGHREKLDARSVTHIPGPSLDGLTGMSLISAARNGLGTGLAADRAAARMFGNGALVAGMVTPDGDEAEWKAADIRAQLDRSVTGWENASDIAVINQRLKFTPWTMTAADAQFIESRQFQIEEVSRWTGVPPHLLMQTDKQTSWGQGVESQNRAMGRTVLNTWASRVEQRLSRLLRGQRVEFDFTGLERPTPEVEAKLVLDLLAAGAITLAEARSRLRLPPMAEAGVTQ